MHLGPVVMLLAVLGNAEEPAPGSRDRRSARLGVNAQLGTIATLLPTVPGALSLEILAGVRIDRWAIFATASAGRCITAPDRYPPSQQGSGAWGFLGVLVEYAFVHGPAVALGPIVGTGFIGREWSTDETERVRPAGARFGSAFTLYSGTYIGLQAKVGLTIGEALAATRGRSGIHVGVDLKVWVSTQGINGFFESPDPGESLMVGPAGPLLGVVVLPTLSTGFDLR